MDLQLIEQGNGGELIKNSKDLSVINGFENMPFLAMFGGNVESSTPVTRLASEQDFSFWANNLLMPQDTSIQFNSKTERAIKTTPLTSAGRATIQQAVNDDLAFMKDFANIEVVVQIIGVDRLLIGIRVLQPDNLQSQDFVYIWDATRAELINGEIIASRPESVTVKYFDSYFDFGFE